MSLNRWIYVEGNPVNYIDPTGHILEKEGKEANSIIRRLETYDIAIMKDWGFPNDRASWSYWYNDPVDSSNSGIRVVCNEWEEGSWQLSELRDVDAGVSIMLRGIRYLGGDFRSLAGSVTLQRQTGTRSGAIGNVINLRIDNATQKRRLYSVIHEMAHVITYSHPETMNYFMSEIGSFCIDGDIKAGEVYCNVDKGVGFYNPGLEAGTAPVFEHLPSDYAAVGNWEDFAETFTVVVLLAYMNSDDQVYKSEAKAVYSNFNHDIDKRQKVMLGILSGAYR